MQTLTDVGMETVQLLTDLYFYIDIFDQREMLIGPSLLDEETGDRDTRQADIWTNNPRFIRGMYELFERLWKTSKSL